MSDWHFDLALQQELDAALERITGWVLEALKPFHSAIPLGEGPEGERTGLSPHQFTMLVAAAEDTQSVPAVVNHLRYQISRSKPGEGWRWQDLGDRIVEWLEEEVRQEATNAAHRAAERVRGEGATEEEIRRAWVTLSTLFLATLRRRFVQRRLDLEGARSPSGTGGGR